MLPPALLASSPPHAQPIDAVVEQVSHAPATLADAAPLLQPMLILLLCLMAGVGTLLLMPGRFNVAWRRLGAAAAGAALFILLLAMYVTSESRPAVYFWIFSAIALYGSLRVVTHPRPVYSALYFVLTVFASAGLFVLLWAEFLAVALIVIYAGAILVTYTFVIMLAADAAPAQPGRGDAGVTDFLAEHDRRARSPFAGSMVGFLTAGVLLMVIYDRAPRELVPRLSVTDPAYFAGMPGQESPGALGEDVLPSEGTTSAGAAPSGGAPRGDLYPANQQSSYANERGGIQSLGIYLFTRQMLSLQLAGLMLTVAMIGAIVIARKQIISELRPAAMGAQERAGEELTMPFTPATDDPKSLPVHGTNDPRQKAYPER